MHSYKKSVFPHVRKFTLIYGPYRLYFDGFFFFFKCLLNFRVHALQSELNKDGYTNFGNLGKEQLDTFDN